MHFLAEYYNMTEHHFKLPGVKGGRTYLLEINPNYVIRSTEDTLNVIDARWIDTSSGMFIDITTVRTDDEARARGRLSALICKDGHQYDVCVLDLPQIATVRILTALKENDIFPLRDSYFENLPVKVPYEYTKLLEAEYGKKALTETHFAK